MSGCRPLHEMGKDGYRIWRFRLVTLDSADLPPARSGDTAPAGRVATVVQRLVRSTNVAAQVKLMHDFTCQVCGLRLMTPAGPYAEAGWRPGTGVNRRARFHFVLRLRGGCDGFGDVGDVAAGDGGWL
jgi:hypothetical protein